MCTKIFCSDHLSAVLFFLNINAQPDQCGLLHAQSLMGGVSDIAVVLKESQNQENIILVVCSLNHFT